MSLLQRFVAHAQDKSVVTFDIFDTLIERNCLVPSDLFYRVGLALFKGISDKAHEFQRCREAAEVELRAAAPNAEVSLADIYALLSQRMGTSLSPDAECAEEIKACAIKKKVEPLFRWAVQHKRVALVSDMYLPAGFISQLLTNCGLSGPGQLVFSCECGCGRRSGKLFNQVLEHYNLRPAQVLHVGDSWGADVRGAQRAGIDSFFVLRRNFIRRFIMERI